VHIKNLVIVIKISCVESIQSRSENWQEIWSWK